MPFIITLVLNPPLCHSLLLLIPLVRLNRTTWINSLKESTVSPEKTRRLECIMTLRAKKPSSQAWASCIWKSTHRYSDRLHVSWDISSNPLYNVGIIISSPCWICKFTHLKRNKRAWIGLVVHSSLVQVHTLLPVVHWKETDCVDRCALNTQVDIRSL